MINDLAKRNERRRKRALRIRSQVRGTAERPRLSVFKSNQHISAQLIDDEAGVTLASASTLTKEFRDQGAGKKSKKSARQVGVKIAEFARQKNVEKAVFDRGFCKYHGLLAEVADGARETGLQF